MKITKEERDIVYKIIYNRRDTRSEFKPAPIPEDVLMRVLKAAHHSPSVGYMQPWNFIIVKDKNIKKSIKDEFETANNEEKKMFKGRRKKLYESFKLEGIIEAPIGICITCDRTRTGKAVIGRTANKEMDLYSSVCAVQTLWLAARSENLGVGWVSIIHYDKLREVLGIPKHIIPIAYLCIGYVTAFHRKPELEEAGWLPRMDLKELIYHDRWGKNQ